MKNGKYNITLSFEITNAADAQEALRMIAEKIIEMNDDEEMIECSMELVEEFDPQYEIDENDCEKDELNFDESA